ncbi:hypothetical protein GCM10010915_02580 [Microbacterium faecale]|uniref:DUF488 domain-containing protein n=1 Tax=Microbacterium faecale TaxID=1804630 RepID=A0A916Y164_9MICO|nr:DUF488 family protein [Microbacterium faecale]GGD26021.1 hypothetical protein GCM10010915_02580 [Microbacterium faecale]
MGELRIKRAYDDANTADGYRVLVDRMWPRGVSKERAALDEHLKDIAPSPDLRTWWNHDPDRIDEFTKRYRAELDNNPAVEDLRSRVRGHKTVTLIYGAKDPDVNHARILRDYLREAGASGEESP